MVVALLLLELLHMTSPSFVGSGCSSAGWLWPVSLEVSANIQSGEHPSYYLQMHPRSRIATLTFLVYPKEPGGSDMRSGSFLRRL
jgi:hypothetical protein